MNIIKRYQPLVIYIILNLFIGGSIIATTLYAYNKISDLRAQIKTQESKNQLFTKKFNSLKQADEDIDSDNLTKLLQVFPSSNSSLFASSQIRSKANDNEVFVEDYSLVASSDPKNNRSYVLINFKANGEIENFLNYISELDKVAPLLELSSIDARARRGQVEADVSLRSYWSDLPTTLPSLTEPLTTLSTQELSLLSEISSYSYPQLDNNSLNPKQYSETRENPFLLETNLIPENIQQTTEENTGEEDLQEEIVEDELLETAPVETE